MGLKRCPRPGPGPGSADIPADPSEAALVGAAAARERSRRGVTREQVADALGVSVTEVAALEAGTGPTGRREITEALVRYRQAVIRAERKLGPAQASP